MLWKWLFYWCNYPHHCNFQKKTPMIKVLSSWFEWVGWAIGLDVFERRPTRYLETSNLLMLYVTTWRCVWYGCWIWDTFKVHCILQLNNPHKRKHRHCPNAMSSSPMIGQLSSVLLSHLQTYNNYWLAIHRLKPKYRATMVFMIPCFVSLL